MNFQEDIIPFLNSPRGQWLAYGCGALVALLLLVSLIKVVLLFVGTGEERVVEEVLEVPIDIAQPAPDIADLHLFGEYKPPTDEEDAESAPITSLNLTLTGIFAAPGDEENATAVITASGGPQRAYAVGASLPGNATIEEILPDRVVIRYRGNRELLLLPQEELPTATFNGLGEQETVPSFQRVEE